MMSARFIFKPNPAGVKKLTRSPQMGKFVDSRTRIVATSIKKAAPRLTGAFARSIKTRSARLEARRGWVGKVYTTDRFWHLEEYGSKNNAPHRSFERGTRAAGVKFTDHRR